MPFSWLWKLNLKEGATAARGLRSARIKSRYWICDAHRQSRFNHHGGRRNRNSDTDSANTHENVISLVFGFESNRRIDSFMLLMPGGRLKCSVSLMPQAGGTCEYYYKEKGCQEANTRSKHHFYAGTGYAVTNEGRPFLSFATTIISNFVGWR